MTRNDHLSERISIGALFVVAAVTAIVFAIVFDVKSAFAAEGSKWSGCYLGGGGQYSMADTKAGISDGLSSIGVDGLGLQGVGLYGQVGCDVELIPGWVVGGYGDYSWDNNADFKVSANFGGTGGDLLKMSLDDSWAVGGRVGRIINDKALIYALLGYTQANLSNITSPLMPGFSLNTPTLKGYQFGGGVDLALKDGWFMEAQYTFSKYGTADIALGGGTNLALDTDVSEVRAGVAYKFNWTPVNEFRADKPLK